MLGYGWRFDSSSEAIQRPRVLLRSSFCEAAIAPNAENKQRLKVTVLLLLSCCGLVALVLCPGSRTSDQKREPIKATGLISLPLESALIAVYLAILGQLAFYLGQTIPNSPAASWQETMITGSGTLPLGVQANHGQGQLTRRYLTLGQSPRLFLTPKEDVLLIRERLSHDV